MGDRVKPGVFVWALPAVLLAAGLLLSILWPLPGALMQNGSVVSLRITDRNGILLREVRPDGRGRPVPLESVSPDVIKALIATEDRHFYRHPGIDPVAMARAAWSNLRNRTIVSGASTITMQVARALRNVHNRGWIDKISEIFLALRLEVYLSKEQILTLWLNRVPFGNRTHGIDAAAHLYFGKSSTDLTTAEAAYLVGLPQSPSRYDPFRYPERARERQLRVLAAMHTAGFITEDERINLSSLPVNLVSYKPYFRAPHLTERLIAFVPDGLDRPAEIRTTIDWPLQQTVEKLLRGHVDKIRANGASNAAAIVIENETGNILAYAGSANFWDTRAGGQNDGVRMLRQPGSALKPFTYALALASRRYTPASILPDIELLVPEAGGAFSPDNYDKHFHGPVALKEALACSYNVPAVYLAREFGAPALLRTLHQNGFASLSQAPDFYGIGLTLGNGEVSLLELARAYAGLARGGSLPGLRTVLWQISTSGDTLYTPAPPPQPTGIPPDVVYLITDILKDPEARAPAFGRGGPLELPFPCAVKTGTSKDYRDNWTVGYTPRYTVAVWAGNFDGKPMQWVSGVTGAGPLFKSIFLELGSGGHFEKPGGIVEAPVCPASGKKATKACTGSRNALFLAGTAPTDTCTVHRIVHLDRRTGLLAARDTPAENVEARVFTVYPPEYHAWMRERGIPLPPTAHSTDAATPGDSLYYTDQLKIRYPESGTIYHIDPVLRDDFQRIRLDGSAPEDMFEISWWVNDQKLPGDYRSSSWPLKPGTFHIELRGKGPDGSLFRSRPSIIHVTGLE